LDVEESRFVMFGRFYASRLDVLPKFVVTEVSVCPRIIHIVRIMASELCQLESPQIAGSAIIGVAGSFLTLAAFNAFFFNMVNGRGWICIALVVFASWKPGKTLLGALLFAFFDALQLRLQHVQGLSMMPYQIYLMLPYIFSILALVVAARKAQYPQALMKPYHKGQR
jgi:hypothetical protein